MSDGRGRHGGGAYRGGYRPRWHYDPGFYSGFHLGFGYPWTAWWYGYGWPWAYGYDYRYGYGGPYAYAPRTVDYVSADWGALDLDIKPEEALIYVNGNLVGEADDYDGFPRYLWLESGPVDLVIYHEGYRTLGKRIDVRPGGVLRLRDEMVRGEAKSPEEMYAEIAPARSREDAPRERLAPWRFRSDEGASTSRREAEPGESWRERRRSGATPPQDESVETDFRSVETRLEILVEPADAVIYLDDRLVGSAGELAERGGTVLLDPGLHVVQISRPGYETRELEVEVARGELETLEVRLEPRP